MGADTQLSDSTPLELGQQFRLQQFFGRAHARAQDGPDHFVPPGAELLGVEFEAVVVPRLQFGDGLKREATRCEMVEGRVGIL